MDRKGRGRKPTETEALPPRVDKSDPTKEVVFNSEFLEKLHEDGA